MGSGESFKMMNFIVRTVHVIVRDMKFGILRWARHVVRIEEARSVLKMLTGRSIGNRTLRRPRRRWEDNIRMDLKEISFNMSSWIDSAQDWDFRARALVRAALNPWV